MSVRRCGVKCSVSASLTLPDPSPYAAPRFRSVGGRSGIVERRKGTFLCTGCASSHRRHRAGARRHVDLIRTGRRSALATLVDPEPGTARLADEPGVSCWSTLDEMLDGERPDGGDHRDPECDAYPAGPAVHPSWDSGTRREADRHDRRGWPSAGQCRRTCGGPIAGGAPSAPQPAPCCREGHRGGRASRYGRGRSRHHRVREAPRVLRRRTMAAGGGRGTGSDQSQP